MFACYSLRKLGLMMCLCCCIVCLRTVFYPTSFLCESWGGALWSFGFSCRGHCSVDNQFWGIILWCSNTVSLLCMWLNCKGCCILGDIERALCLWYLCKGHFGHLLLSSEDFATLLPFSNALCFGCYWKGIVLLVRFSGTFYFMSLWYQCHGHFVAVVALVVQDHCHRHCTFGATMSEVCYVCATLSEAFCAPCTLSEAFCLYVHAKTLRQGCLTNLWKRYCQRLDVSDNSASYYCQEY